MSSGTDRGEKAMDGKLVRDRIPEIIKESGRDPLTGILSEEEYIKELDKKLLEEVNEYLADKSIEEIADVIEVLLAICKARGYDKEKVETLRLQKKEERGAFENRIFWYGNK